MNSGSSNGGSPSSSTTTWSAGNRQTYQRQTCTNMSDGTSELFWSGIAPFYMPSKATKTKLLLLAVQYPPWTAWITRLMAMVCHRSSNLVHVCAFFSRDDSSQVKGHFSSDKTFLLLSECCLFSGKPQCCLCFLCRRTFPMLVQGGQSKSLEASQ